MKADLIMMCLTSSSGVSARMDTYEIIMTPDAADDLIRLRDYIADTLLAPDTARAYLRMLRTEIKTYFHAETQQMPR